ncbi:hypothetical protein ATCC90586_005233 [Pythium insidiosum]|nr:hypothetical protein ATCC90586_005233 [Pythium insidiosum]
MRRAPDRFCEKLSKTSRQSSSGVGAASAPTLASEAIARAVTRSEFQELVAAVSQLKQQTQRQLSVENGRTEEAQVGSELQVFAAAVASNKSALGKVAELVLEKTSELQERVATQLQQFQVESNKRLTDVALAIERLEFRFKHHIRDCQTVAEQVDVQREALAHVKTQLGQTQLLVDQQRDDQRAFVETVQYTSKACEDKTVQYTSKACEDKVAAATASSAKSLEAFKQRVIAFVKGVETSTRDYMAAMKTNIDEHREWLRSRPKNALQQCLNSHVINSYLESRATRKAVQWGHDFRKDYMNLGQLRSKFQTVPIMALTATANSQTEADIVRNLHLSTPFITRSSFNRI